jgi:hypothetical protein
MTKWKCFGRFNYERVAKVSPFSLLYFGQFFSPRVINSHKSCNWLRYYWSWCKAIRCRHQYAMKALLITLSCITCHRRSATQGTFDKLFVPTIVPRVFQRFNQRLIRFSRQFTSRRPNNFKRSNLKVWSSLSIAFRLSGAFLSLNYSWLNRARKPTIFLYAAFTNIWARGEKLE